MFDIYFVESFSAYVFWTHFLGCFAESRFPAAVLCNAVWMCDTGMSRDAAYLYCYWAGNTNMHKLISWMQPGQAQDIIKYIAFTVRAVLLRQSVLWVGATCCRPSLCGSCVWLLSCGTAEWCTAPLNATTPCSPQSFCLSWRTWWTWH